MTTEHREHPDSDHITMVESPSPPLGSNKLNDVEKNGANGQVVGTGGKTDVTVDAVWGDVGTDGPNYRNLGWCVPPIPTTCVDLSDENRIRAAVLETKTQIGLGVLGLVSHTTLAKRTPITRLTGLSQRYLIHSVSDPV